MGGSDRVRLCPGGGGGGLFFDRVELPLAGVCAAGVEGGRFDNGGAGGKTNIKQVHADVTGKNGYCHLTWARWKIQEEDGRIER